MVKSTSHYYRYIIVVVSLCVFGCFAKKVEAVDYYSCGQSGSAWYESDCTTPLGNPTGAAGDTINITGGSSVVYVTNTLNSAVYVTNGSSLTIGYLGGENMIVSDGGSISVNGTLSCVSSNACVTIQSGGYVTIGDDGALQTDESNTITIDQGALYFANGATLNLSGTLNIGNGTFDYANQALAFGNGDVVLSADRTISSVDNWTFDSGGQLRLSSSTLTVQSGGDLTMNIGSTLRFSGGNIVQQNSNWQTQANVIVDSNVHIPTGLTWTLATSSTVTVNNSTTLTVDNGATFRMMNNADATINAGGQLLILGTFENNHVFTLNSGATSTVGSAGVLQLNSSSVVGGVLDVLDGGTSHTTNLTVNGNVYIRDGGLFDTAGVIYLNNTSTSTIIAATSSAWKMYTGFSVQGNTNPIPGYLVNYNPTSYSFTNAELPYNLTSATSNNANNYNTILSRNHTSWSVAGLPAGLSFSQETGVISGTPTGTASGVLYITGISPNGTSTQAVSYTLTAVTLTPSPAITSNAPQNIIGPAGGSSPVSQSWEVKKDSVTVYPPTVFKKNISLGHRHKNVYEIQVLLNTELGFPVAISGPGSKGFETNYYGPATRQALGKFQIHLGIVKSSKDKGFGVFGPKTREKINEILKK